ncbi:unnamed protein product [Microthlaspi erraticum]|uniref:F-box domain-containing protein n=1 Tax=Microthlaspi erraticum TaxID=1685480 RepID=A0A6D2LBJ7_9BRAS|nr:unnamed protein product [Microthlaspi erraticum]
MTHIYMVEREVKEKLGSMGRISDLSGDLVGEILSRAPLTSLSAVRSTCKSWNDLSENQIFGKQLLGFMVMDSIQPDLRHGLAVNTVSMFKQVEITRVYHCDGLLLCAGVRNNTRSVVVWNPYLGQTRWIQPINEFAEFDMFALGYSSNNVKSREHKMLRFLDWFDGEKQFQHSYFEMYCIESDSWRVLHVNPEWSIHFQQRGVTVKGNTYLVAQDKSTPTIPMDTEVGVWLLCFDFTTERFGPRLPLPTHSYCWFTETLALSGVGDEQLALLYQSPTSKIMDFWITTKLEPNAVSWSKFLRVDTRLLSGFPANFCAGSFFVDEENKLAVVSYLPKSYLREYEPMETCRHLASLYIVGDGHDGGDFKPLNIRQSTKSLGYFNEFSFSCYVPSLVQINQRGKKRKHGGF